MTTGELNELKNFMKADSFHKVIAYIEQVKEKTAGISEWVFFDGEEVVKAIALNKSNYKETVKEFHKTYTDIHITISGVDTIFTGDQVTGVIEPYQESGDYSLVQSPSVTASKILPGHFAVIPPNEIHSNELAGESPLKVVIKLK